MSEAWLFLLPRDGVESQTKSYISLGLWTLCYSFIIIFFSFFVQSECERTVTAPMPRDTAQYETNLRYLGVTCPIVRAWLERRPARRRGIVRSNRRPSDEREISPKTESLDERAQAGARTNQASEKNRLSAEGQK